LYGSLYVFLNETERTATKLKGLKNREE